MQLVASWVRETFAGEPYVAIPCENDRYIAWARESELPWDTEMPAGF
jgi:hypothetical protein